MNRESCAEFFDVVAFLLGKGLVDRVLVGVCYFGAA